MSRRVWIAVALVLLAGAYFVLDVRQRARIDRAPKSHRTDFTVYQYASRALARGADPYEARNPRGYRYVYPPLLSVLLLPIAAWDPADAALVFYLLSAAAFAAVCLGLARWRAGADAPRLGWVPVAVAVLVCLGFAHQGFQRGQVTHILLFLQGLALWDLRAQRFVRAGLWLGLAGALRLTPLLPALAVGVGLLVHAVRRRAPARPLRFGGGLAAGLIAGFVVLPVLALGAGRAQRVTERWLEVTQAVYADGVDLEAEYHINEWRFKNQAPRRVFGTWAGWIEGAPFDGERPLLGAAARDAADGAAETLTWGLLALALLMGCLWLREPADGRFGPAYAAVMLLPVWMTRYAWPTHYLMALPAVALMAAAGAGRPRFAVSVLLGGTAAFYAAHARVLQPVGEAGVLVLSASVFLAVLVTGLARRPTP